MRLDRGEGDSLFSEAAIVIPVYNHGSQVGAVIERALEFQMPLVVVDDGSTDQTPQVLARFEGLRIITHPRNLGKGAALISGLEEAARFARWAVTIDADGQHDPADVVHLFEVLPAGSRPLVVGKREGLTKAAGAPLSSRFGRRFSNFWVAVSGGPHLTDTQSGFRLYPLPETINLRPKARRFNFEVEILVLARRAGLPVLEIPVRSIYPPKKERVSHFRPWSDFWRNAFTFTRLIASRILLSIKG